MKCFDVDMFQLNSETKEFIENETNSQFRAAIIKGCYCWCTKCWKVNTVESPHWLESTLPWLFVEFCACITVDKCTIYMQYSPHITF